MKEIYKKSVWKNNKYILKFNQTNLKSFSNKKIITSILLVICYNIDHGLLLLFLSLIAILVKQIDIHRNLKKNSAQLFSQLYGACSNTTILWEHILSIIWGIKWNHGLWFKNKNIEKLSFKGVDPHCSLQWNFKLREFLFPILLLKIFNLF
jgi:hypothetical protein